ncbi:hypothetical protein [Polyangium fumosum]|uniref:Uncharacterized protein n=1 Tax=Polyangium fumosum TaxID=889272 RepID=A0A4U1JIB9_9BACT|nr:hypothetical protein [Polyangium fumosum]TKD12373.1 hypothetical protein E8A74_04545 [Polyangium fumosum]
MDFAHFETLVRGTLQRDLIEPGLYVEITTRDDGDRWVAQVVAPGRGAAHESVRRGVGQAEAVEAVARLVERIRGY